MNEPFLVAAAQLAPALLDLETSIDKACQWITKAGEENVKVLVFPETWLPGYPIWLDSSPEAALWGHTPTKEIFQRLVENSSEIPSPALGRLCEAAADARLTLVMGLHERDGHTLYNTICQILLAHPRYEIHLYRQYNIHREQLAPVPHLLPSLHQTLAYHTSKNPLGHSRKQGICGVCSNSTVHRL